jgi:hypothetical protein
MTERNDRVVYEWRGVWNPGGPGWYEWFGGDEGLPPRDLTEADLAGFTEAQLAKLNSPAGKRLYVPVKQRRETGNTPAGADG